MKKLIILGLMVLLFLNSKAQEYEYVPFPTHDAEWSNLDNDNGLPHGYTKINSIYHILNLDTVINNFTYHKLFRFIDSLVDREKSILTGFITEEDKKIYFYNGINGGLLYDFNLNIGDTLDYVYPYDVNLIVSKIDTIKLGEKLRRRFFFTWSDIYLDGMCWIEGIGSTNGLLWPGTYPVGNHYKLLCYKENNNLIYYNEQFDTCYPDYPKIYNSINENKTLLSLIIEPNPAFDDFKIRWVKVASGLLKIYSLDGKLILTQKVEKAQSIEITAGKFNKGLFIVMLQTESELFAGKLLIKR